MLAVPRLPSDTSASPALSFTRLLTTFTTPATAMLPHRLELPPRTISTRSMLESGSLNHWVVM